MISSLSISTKVYDNAGHVLLFNLIEQSSKIRDYRRRLTRTATLDTGAYIDDRGYFDGDRTIEVAVSGDKALFDSLLYITQNYGSLFVFLPDGAYNGNIQRLTQDGGRIRLTLLIESEA